MTTLTTIKLPPPTGVDFPVQKLLSGHTAWILADFSINSELTGDDVYSFSNKTQEQVFFDKFAYAIADSFTLESLNFDYQQEKTYQAERYGGRGIGTNGGGVRVGNCGGYQIKGIGKNPLCGPTQEVLHSYGALNAIEAVYETIYTAVLNKIMPIGVANIYGIIVTGAESAYYTYNEDDPNKQQKGWGALMVREVCRRPAHFFRAGHYPDLPKYERQMPTDVVRVRLANKALMKEFGTANNFIMYLGKFLQNCANQLAFARIARIAHSNLSPSNVSLDGRWLDVACTTFVRGGENSGWLNSFYKEPERIVPLLKELVDGFGKYNNVDLNVAPLINYYKEQFSSYLSYHTCYLFSLDYEKISKNTKKRAYTELVKQSNLVISSGERVFDFPSELKEDDPVIALIEGLFLSLFNKDRAMVVLNPCLTIVLFDVNLTIKAFHAVIKDVYKNTINIHANTKTNYSLFIKQLLITSVKHALIPVFFYKKRMDPFIKIELANKGSKAIASIIDNAIEVGEWGLVDNSLQRITLFQGNGVTLFFDTKDANYYFTSIKSISKKSTALASQAITYINSYCASVYVINGFDFKPYLLRLFNLLHTIEVSDHG